MDSDLALFATFVFAYITVAFFAAKRLSKFQVISVSTLYSIFILFLIAQAFLQFNAMYAALVALDGVGSMVFPIGVPVAQILVWSFSLYFMFQSRRE